jgi:hypothetical protein
MNCSAHMNFIQTEQVYIEINVTELLCPHKSQINRAELNENPCNRRSFPTNLKTRRFNPRSM